MDSDRRSGADEYPEHDYLVSGYSRSCAESDNEGRPSMSTPRSDESSPSSDRSDAQSTPERETAPDPNRDVTKIVDDLEKQVADERRREGIPGNAADRAQSKPIDTGDRAPD